MTKPPETAVRRRKRLERRMAAAEAGRHLPTLDELLHKSPFMGGSVAVDAQAFAERVLPRVPDDGCNGSRLRAALEAMTVDPAIEEFKEASAAFLAVREEMRAKYLGEGRYTGRRRVPDPAVGALRCAFYAAASGCGESAWMAAAEAMALASDRAQDDDAILTYAASAIGWLLIASDSLPTAARHNGIARHVWGDAEERVRILGDKMFARIQKSAADAAAEPESPAAEAPKQTAETDGEPSGPVNAAVPGIVMFREIGSATTGDGKRVLKEYEALLGKSLPLVPVPNLLDARRTLIAEFPYASKVIDGILTEVCASVSGVRFRPTVFVGTPGCGKTMFAGRLFDVLGVRHEVYSCGGVSDPALAGTPRRWSTGEPSLPVALAKRWGTASPGIVLDEIEKVATSRHNGNLLDGLLGLLEQQSSACWHDPYVEAPCDLSRVLWLATANSLDGLPGPLRDRCRIAEFPEPAADHLEAIAAAVLKKTVADQGLDPRWACPLDGEELDALRQFWRGGSVRRLARLVDAVLAARGRGQGVH